MRKKVKRKTILIDGIRYYDDKPDTCRKCFFWKNRKVGCVLGTQNCYYLAEAVKTEQEKKCEGCCYAKGHPCVSAVCYKELDAWLRANRANRANQAPDRDCLQGLWKPVAGLRCRPSPVWLFSCMEVKLPMAKTKTEIHVTTVFDGELDATDVFVSPIAQKHSRKKGEENLVKSQDLDYNKDKVPSDRVPSGLCG